MNKGLFFFIFCLDSLPSDSSPKRPEKKQASISKTSKRLNLPELDGLLVQASKTIRCAIFDLDIYIDFTLGWFLAPLP